MYLECLHSSDAVCSGIECVLLKRLAYPCRYFDPIYRFARPVPELCMIYNVVLDWIYITNGHSLTSWNRLFLTLAWLQQYARALYQLGCPFVLVLLTAPCVPYHQKNINDW